MLVLKKNRLAQLGLQPMTFTGSSDAKTNHVCAVYVSGTYLFCSGSSSQTWTISNLYSAVIMNGTSYGGLIQKISCNGVNIGILCNVSICLIGSSLTGATTAYVTGGGRIYSGAQTSIPNY
jgi:hypothetical protein